MPMNYMKTAMLLAALTALFVALGGLVGGKSGMVIAFVIALGHERVQLLEGRHDGAAHVRRAGGR